ncbi:MAG: glycine/sarcosine/betaine reductase selenoprotein B family protein [Chloroflexota bacterium]
MEILEDVAQWQAEYKQNWLAHYKETGDMDWRNRYNRPKNKTAPSGSGIDLSQSRLMLISSAGGYLPESQTPFNTNKPDLGDYTLRQFPSSTSFSDIAYSHGFYDHSAVDEDPQVLLPLRHLETLADEGVIGEMASSVVSFCGWLPDVVRTIDELIPAIVAAAKAEEVDAALLVPA